MLISLFETKRFSVSISPRNIYNALKSIKRNAHILFSDITHCYIIILLAGKIVGIAVSAVVGVMVLAGTAVLCVR